MSSGSAGSGLQRSQVGEAEGRRQRVGDARVGDVGVGVRDVQRDTGPHERGDGAALGVRGGDGVHPAQQQRVVRDQQVRTPRDRLVDDGLHRVDREQHPAYRLVRVAHDQPDGVPVLRPARVVERVERGDHVAEAERLRHGRAVTLTPAPGTGRTQSSWVPPSMDNRHE